MHFVGIGHRMEGHPGGSRTLELLLGDLGASTCGIEVVTHATSSSDAEVERELGLGLGHCV
jgi:hypothetical protein